MSKSIPLRRRRLLVAKLILELHRINTRVVFQGEPFGSRATDALLIVAAFIGQAEGKPMNAGKLAEYAGVPRPTVIRRMSVMQDEGHIYRRADACYVLQTQFLDAPTDDALKASMRAIRLAAVNLSKLDT